MREELQRYLKQIRKIRNIRIKYLIQTKLKKRLNDDKAKQTRIREWISLREMQESGVVEDPKRRQSEKTSTDLETNSSISSSRSRSLFNLSGEKNTSRPSPRNRRGTKPTEVRRGGQPHRRSDAGLNLQNYQVVRWATKGKLMLHHSTHLISVPRQKWRLESFDLLSHHHILSHNGIGLC